MAEPATLVRHPNISFIPLTSLERNVNPKESVDRGAISKRVNEVLGMTKAELKKKTIKIGQGTYGSVRLVRNCEDGSVPGHFALKIEHDMLPHSGCSACSVREYAALKAVSDCSSCVPLHASLFRVVKGQSITGCEQVAVQHTMAFETATMNLAMLPHMFAERRICLRLPSMQRIMFEILKGVHYSNVHNIMHRDLKPANILLTLEKSTNRIADVWLADFGLSRNYYGGNVSPLTPVVCTVNYRAPELLTKVNKMSGYTNSVDIWSVGLTFVHLITGTDLFSDSNSTKMINAIYKLLGAPDEATWNEWQTGGVEYLPENFPHRNKESRWDAFVSEKIWKLDTLFIEEEGVLNKQRMIERKIQVKNLLECMIQLKPSARWSAERILKEHPFFDDIRHELNIVSFPTEISLAQSVLASTKLRKQRTNVKRERPTTKTDYAEHFRRWTLILAHYETSTRSIFIPTKNGLKEAFFQPASLARVQTTPALFKNDDSVQIIWKSAFRKKVFRGLLESALDEYGVSIQSFIRAVMLFDIGLLEKVSGDNRDLLVFATVCLNIAIKLEEEFVLEISDWIHLTPDQVHCFPVVECDVLNGTTPTVFLYPTALDCANIVRFYFTKLFDRLIPNREEHDKFCFRIFDLVLCAHKFPNGYTNSINTAIMALLWCEINGNPSLDKNDSDEIRTVPQQISKPNLTYSPNDYNIDRVVTDLVADAVASQTNELLTLSWPLEKYEYFFQEMRRKDETDTRAIAEIPPLFTQRLGMVQGEGLLRLLNAIASLQILFGYDSESMFSLVSEVHRIELT